MEDLNIYPGWEVVRVIGRGSFGKVYEIKKEGMFDDNVHSALKVISIPEEHSETSSYRDDGLDDESITAIYKSRVEDIAAEFKLMSQLRGTSNIVSYEDHSIIQHENAPGWDIYIRMELLTTLPDYYKQQFENKTVNDKVVAQIGIDICKALELCAKHGIIHRDIKPQNIFVSANGDFKLGDFGIARTSDHTTRATKTGTYGYMAPEVHKSEPYNSSVDLYSLGLVLYWLLNERRGPFQPLPPEVPRPSDNENALSRRISGETLPPPRNGEKRLHDIILKACAYAPKDRFASATDMRIALETFLAGGVAVFDNPIQEDELDKTVGVFSGATAENLDMTEGTVGIFSKRQYDNGAINAETAVGQSTRDGKKKRKALFAIGAAALVVLVGVGSVLKGMSNRGSGSVPSDISDSSKSVIADISVNTEAEQGEQQPEQATKNTTWSDWMDSLPRYVSDSTHQIQTRTLYSSRKLETTTSDKQAMKGWELYDTIDQIGDYGPWSDWTTTSVNETGNRQVETEKRYRYRDKETTTASTSYLDGWNYEKTTTSFGNWGAWSDWTENAVYKDTDTRQSQSKTQYSYRTKQTTQSSNELGGGWIVYDTDSSYSGWSSWQDSAVSSSATREVDTRQVYHYYYYVCANCGAHMHGYGQCYAWAGGCGSSAVYDSSYHAVNYTVPYSSASDWYGTNTYYADGDAGRAFAYTSSSSPYYIAPKTQYRYRDLSTTYYMYKWSDWSSYSDAAVSANSNREVATKTVSRYRERELINTYHFTRMGAWSDWSTTQVSATNDRQVENATYYRHRDKVTQTTYCFRRWTEWTKYSTDKVNASDTVEVATMTQYRFIEK